MSSKSGISQAYENAKIYKEKIKAWHDRYICKHELCSGEKKYLLFNSCLCLFSRKLRSQWSGSFVVKEVFLHGVVEIALLDGSNVFKVN